MRLLFEREIGGKPKGKTKKSKLQLSLAMYGGQHFSKEVGFGLCLVLPCWDSWEESERAIAGLLARDSPQH